MGKLEVSVIIKRPVEEVFSFVNDPTNETLWSSGLVESSQISDGPIGVGTKMREVNRILGKRIENTYEITEYEPNRRYSCKSISGPFPWQGSFTFESVEGGTKVTMSSGFEVGSFFKLAEPLVIRMAKRQFQADFNNLKDLMEAKP
ncbi:SRPBCC family protein [Chloroflexota bacterium]